MIPDFLRKKEPLTLPVSKIKFSFIEKTLHKLVLFGYDTLWQWRISTKKGLLQRCHPFTKLLFLLVGVIVVSLVHTFLSLFCFNALLIVLAVVSFVPITYIVSRSFLLAFIFGFIFLLPSSLNIFYEGEKLITVFSFSKSFNIWIYNIPNEIYITIDGFLFVVRVALKIFTSLSLVFIILATTAYEPLIQSLHVLKIPSIVIMIFTLSYNFIFTLSQVLTASYKAIKLRWWHNINRPIQNDILSGRMGYIFKKASLKYEKTYYAMVARGFSNNIKLQYSLQFSIYDYFLIFSVIIGLILIFLIEYYGFNL